MLRWMREFIAVDLGIGTIAPAMLQKIHKGTAGHIAQAAKIRGLFAQVTAEPVMLSGGKEVQVDISAALPTMAPAQTPRQPDAMNPFRASEGHSAGHDSIKLSPFYYAYMQRACIK